MKAFLKSGHLTTAVWCVSLLALIACSQNNSGSSGTPQNKAATSPLPFPGLAKPAKDLSDLDGVDFNDDAKESATNPGTTGAKVASDTLMLSLSNKMDRMNAVSADLATANNRAAGSIQSIETSIDANSKVSVAITGKDAKTINLSGTLQEQLAVLTADDQSALGSLKRLDQVGVTDKVGLIASLDLQSISGKNEVMAILRHTNARISSVALDKIPANPSDDFRTIQNLMIATSSGAKSGSVIQTIFFNSSEVVHGETFVRISMVTNDNQVIGLKGNLKLPTAMKFTEGTLTKDVQPAAVRAMIPNASDIKTDLQNMILSAQILRVDSASEFTLLLDVKGPDSDSRQTVSIKLNRY